MDVEEARENIRNWLLEEGFTIQQIPNQNTEFNFAATDEQNMTVNVVQVSNSKDRVIIATRMLFTASEVPGKLEAMAVETRTDFMWHLRLSLLAHQVGFSGVGIPLDTIELSAVIYYDGLTKDQFMQRLFRLRGGLQLVNWLFNEKFREPPAPQRSIGFPTS